MKITEYEEAQKRLEAMKNCATLEMSGTSEKCNEFSCETCKFNYEQGTLGEQIKALEVAIEGLEWIIHPKLI